MMIDKIEKLVIEGNKKKLIEIAFDIENEEEFNKIFDYFLEIKDGFNIGELLSIANEYANIIEVANKIVETKDAELIFYLLHFGPILNVVDEKFFDILRKSEKNEI